MPNRRHSERTLSANEHKCDEREYSSCEITIRKQWRQDDLKIAALEDRLNIPSCDPAEGKKGTGVAK